MFEIGVDTAYTGTLEFNPVTTTEDSFWCAVWPQMLLHHVKYLQSSRTSDLLPCSHLALLKQTDRRNTTSVYTFLPHWAKHTIALSPITTFVAFTSFLSVFFGLFLLLRNPNLRMAAWQ